jgi:uncharacterized protein
MWFDLSAADSSQAREIYSTMFGWAIAPADNAGPYQAWITDGQQPWAGIVQASTAAGAGWLPYVVVEDLDDAGKKSRLTPLSTAAGTPAA